jgi:hypothetical protein
MQPRLLSRALRRPSRLAGTAMTSRLAPMHENSDDTAASSAEYIAQMTSELAEMANSAKFDMLTYLLNMARLEAEFRALRQKS